MKINSGTLRLADTLTPPSTAQTMEEQDDTTNPMKTGDRVDISADAKEAASGLFGVRLTMGSNKYGIPTSAGKTSAEDAKSSGVRLDGKALQGGEEAEKAEGSSDGDKVQQQIERVQKQITKLQEQRNEIASQPEGKARDQQLAAIDSQIAVLQSQLLELMEESGGGSSGGTPGLEAKGGGMGVKANFAWEKKA